MRGDFYNSGAKIQTSNPAKYTSWDGASNQIKANHLLATKNHWQHLQCAPSNNLCSFQHNYKNYNNDYQHKAFLPQMKQEFFRISSFCCFSLLRSANVSMITPKMRLRTIMITMKKKRRS